MYLDSWDFLNMKFLVTIQQMEGTCRIEKQWAIPFEILPAELRSFVDAQQGIVLNVKPITPELARELASTISKTYPKSEQVDLSK